MQSVINNPPPILNPWSDPHTLEPDEIRRHFTALAEASQSRVANRKAALNELLAKYVETDEPTSEQIEALCVAAREAGLTTEGLAKRLAWRTRAAKLRASAPDLQQARETIAKVRKALEDYDKETHRMELAEIEKSSVWETVNGVKRFVRAGPPAYGIVGPRLPEHNRLVKLVNEEQKRFSRVEKHFEAMRFAEANGVF